MAFSGTFSYAKEFSVQYGYAFMTDGDVNGDSLSWQLDSLKTDSKIGWGVRQSLNVGNSSGSKSLLFASEKYDDEKYFYKSMDAMVFSSYGIYRPFNEIYFDIYSGLSYSFNKHESWSIVFEDPVNETVVAGPNTTRHSKVFGLYSGLKLGIVNTKNYSIGLFAVAHGIRVVGPEGYSVGLSFLVNQPGG
jgi:hypothetical protein